MPLAEGIAPAWLAYVGTDPEIEEATAVRAELQHTEELTPSSRIKQKISPAVAKSRFNPTPHNAKRWGSMNLRSRLRKRTEIFGDQRGH
jgi:hypothetical protein